MLKKYIKILLAGLLISVISFGIYKFFFNSQSIPTPVNLTPNINNNYKLDLWMIISFALFLMNLLVVIVIFKILSWRKSVSNGMMAVVPSSLLTNVNLVTDSQSKLIQWLQANITQITKLLKDNSESITILKNELAIKENEIDSLKDGQLKNEKNKFINKVVKLHIFFVTLIKQIENKEIEANVALKVLSEELSEIFSEFEIYLINPDKHTPLQNIVSEGYTVKEVIKTESENLNSTVEKVIDLGYYSKTPENKIRIIKPAILVINKFGE